MKKISDVHGRFNSFSAVADALGMKLPKVKAEKPRKCPNCGGELRRVGSTNVWICDFSILEEAEYKKKNETVEVYVIKKCPHSEIDLA